MVHAMEEKPWEPRTAYRRCNKFNCMIKEQYILCGFKGNNCRTVVTLQRFRNNEQWIVGWMRDLVRLRVVKKWRVDRGTRDKEWQAQKGASAKEERAKEMAAKNKGTEAPRNSLELVK